MPLLFAAVACVPGGGRSADAGVRGDSIVFRHARLIHVYRHSGWLLAKVDNPWKSGETLHTYIIVPNGGDIPENIPQGTVVRTPLERSVVFTSVHCGLLGAFGRLGAVKGVCDARYVVSPKVRRYIEGGSAGNMGSSMQPDVERIIALNPDGLLVSPFAGGEYGKLATAGLPLIECADYMEKSPLARAEWMRFFGLLYGCGDEADSLFAQVERNYTDLCRQVAPTSTRPAVMCDIMQGGAWYVPGGESTTARLLRDAGANYVFANNTESGSVRLSPEQILTKARNADVWIIRYGSKGALGYDALRRENAIYAEFKPWTEKKIFACNTFKVPYYDEIPFRPDYALRDLVAIFHPELDVRGGGRYFTPMK